MSATTQVSSESRGQYKAEAYVASSASSPLVPTTIPRRDPGEHDVQIKILFCGICHSDLHQVTLTYNSPDVHLGGITYGGYSASIVVRERFVLHIPSSLNLAGAAPLLCAGITTYSPMRHWGVTKGKKVGVVGLGGLGHMALKLAHAFGAHVVVFTTSPNKKEDALRLGADDVVISRNTDEMSKHKRSFDFILDESK
jgi:alcohol dehydrogenase (NADP+)